MLAVCARPSLRPVHVEREALGHSILPISLTITGENSKSNKIVNLGRVAAIPYYLTTLGLNLASNEQETFFVFANLNRPCYPGKNRRFKQRMGEVFDYVKRQLSIRIPDMRTGRTIPLVKCGIPALCILLWGRGWSRAEQASDAASVPIHLKYTYAELPFAGMTPTQTQQLGTLGQPGNDQDKKFRTIFASAAAVITGATRNKVRFEKLDYVADVQAADLVISLAGGNGRLGWATPGAFGARPGQIGLYYRCLTKEREEDAILIVAHLLSHYLFDLPDEVNEDGVRASCPQQNPDGPGCLMDNFFADGPRRGYYGKFCGDKDHNPTAPVSSTLSARHKSQESCQFWVNHFLRRNLVAGEISLSSARPIAFRRSRSPLVLTPVPK